MKGEHIQVEATRLTPEEEEQLRSTPLRTVRAREVKAPPTPAERERAKWRALAVGATVAVGAGAVAAFGYYLLKGRRALRRKHA